MNTDNQPLVEMVFITDLKPDPKNPRTISANEFESLQRSIDEFGMVEPVVVNRRNMTICGGHMRVRAAKELGLEKVPVVWVDLDPKAQTALNIALNKISGEFDLDMLPELIMELDENLLSLTGFDEAELAKLQADPFDEPEPDKKPKEPKFALSELRKMAQSYHPANAQTILEFCDWLEERAA